MRMSKPALPGFSCLADIAEIFLSRSRRCRIGFVPAPYSEGGEESMMIRIL